MVRASFAIGDDGTVTEPDSAYAPGEWIPLRPNPRSIILSLSGTVTALVLCLLTLVPLPYWIEKPGDTFDLFAAYSGGTRLSLSGTPTYPPSGELRLTTVAVQGGPGSNITIGQLIREWCSPAAAVFPIEEVSSYVTSGSAQRDWISSQEKAMIAALEHQGIDIPMVATLSEIEPDSNGTGLLEVGDVILAVNGTDIVNFSDLDAVFDPLKPGDEVTVTVDRSGREVTVAFATIDDGDGGAIMGVWYDPVFSFPFEVNIRIDNVGGPSGGMMFALGILDLLTPEDELQGERVAGTGTIDVDGGVGPIGGIDLKMHGAASAGAEWFLAPEANCPWVVGRVPDGLTVVAVSTLDEAYDAIVAIGEGRTDALPSCG